jgi:selenocysteine-specific elongation factor
VCALPGDRFIVRNAQATRTVGGGVVLDPFPSARKRRSPKRLAYLSAIERMLAGEGFSLLLQHAPHGVRVSALMRLTGEPREHMALPPEAVIIDSTADGDDPFVFLRSHWLALRERILQALRDFHAQSPEEPGPESSRLRRIAAPDLHEAAWRSLIDELIRDGLILRNGAWLHLPGHAATLSPDDEDLAARLLPLIIAGRFDPPWVRDLARAVRAPEDRVRHVLHKLVLRLHRVVPTFDEWART